MLVLLTQSSVNRFIPILKLTSGLHAQAEKTKKQKRAEKAASGGGSDKDPETRRWGLTRVDDAYYYICLRLKLDRETENMGVCTKEREGVAADILMAASCTLSHKLSRK